MVNNGSERRVPSSLRKIRDRFNGKDRDYFDRLMYYLTDGYKSRKDKVMTVRVTRELYDLLELLVLIEGNVYDPAKKPYLSLKDNTVGGYLSRLLEAFVRSEKIRGRLLDRLKILRFGSDKKEEKGGIGKEE